MTQLGLISRTGKDLSKLLQTFPLKGPTLAPDFASQKSLF